MKPRKKTLDLEGKITSEELGDFLNKLPFPRQVMHYQVVPVEHRECIELVPIEGVAKAYAIKGGVAAFVTDSAASQERTAKYYLAQFLPKEVAQDAIKIVELSYDYHHLPLSGERDYNGKRHWVDLTVKGLALLPINRSCAD